MSSSTAVAGMQDREAVLARAREANVTSIIVTGTCMHTTAAAAALCDKLQATGDGSALPQLYFTAGVHPHNAKVGAAACSSSRHEAFLAELTSGMDREDMLRLQQVIGA